MPAVALRLGRRISASCPECMFPLVMTGFATCPLLCGGSLGMEPELRSGRQYDRPNRGKAKGEQ